MLSIGLLYPALSWGKTLAPTLPQSLIAEALVERQLGNVERSIQILHSGLELHPENLRIKLELASSYFANQEYDDARKLAQEVAGQGDIPDVVRNNIKQFLAMIEQRQPDARSKTITRHMLNLFSGYDSNANIAPEDQQIDIGELTQDSIQQSDQFYGLQYDYSRFTPVTLSQPDIGESFYYHSGISLYYKDYQDVDSSDIYFINARAGVRYKLSNDWNLQGKVSVTHIGLDEQALVNYYDLSALLAYRFDHSTLSFALESSHKEYSYSEDSDRQGYHISPGLRYKVMLPKQASFNVDVKHTAANLSSNQHAYDAYEYKAILALPFNVYKQPMSLEIMTGRNHSHYRGIETHYTDKRHDTTEKYSLKISAHQLYRQLNMELSYNWLERQSNHEIHQYQRELVTLSLKYPFGSN